MTPPIPRITSPPRLDVVQTKRPRGLRRDFIQGDSRCRIQLACRGRRPTRENALGPPPAPFRPLGDPRTWAIRMSRGPPGIHFGLRPGEPKAMQRHACCGRGSGINRVHLTSRKRGLVAIDQSPELRLPWRGDEGGLSLALGPREFEAMGPCAPQPPRRRPARSNHRWAAPETAPKPVKSRRRLRNVGARRFRTTQRATFPRRRGLWRGGSGLAGPPNDSGRQCRRRSMPGQHSDL
jgi:hypothetical protein